MSELTFYEAVLLRLDHTDMKTVENKKGFFMMQEKIIITAAMLFLWCAGISRNKAKESANISIILLH